LVHIFVAKVVITVSWAEVDQAHSGEVVWWATVFRDRGAEHIDFAAEVGSAEKNLEVIIFPLVTEEVLNRLPSPFVSICPAHSQLLLVVVLRISSASMSSLKLTVMRCELFRYHQIYEGIRYQAVFLGDNGAHALSIVFIISVSLVQQAIKFEDVQLKTVGEAHQSRVEIAVTVADVEEAV